MNVNNRNRMGICNSCAERHFGITLSSKLERIVRRIKENASYTINDELIDHMTSRHIIDEYEQESYLAIRSKRNITSEDFSVRARLNMRLIAYTLYENKQALDDINSIAAWAISNENLNSRNLNALRHQILQKKINPEDIVKFRKMLTLRYEPSYDEVVQAETMMLYVDPYSERTMCKLIETYGSPSQKKKRYEECRRERLKNKREAYFEYNFLSSPVKVAVVVKWDEIPEWDRKIIWTTPVLKDVPKIPYKYDGKMLYATESHLYL